MTKSKEEHLKNSGERIKHVRRDLLRLSREIFSQKHNISAGTLQGWETNRYKKLSESTVEIIIQAFEAEGLSCSKEWLLSGKGKAPHKKQKTNGIARKFLFPSRIHAEERELILEQSIKNQQQHDLNKKLIEACEEGLEDSVEQAIDQGANAHLLTNEQLHFYDNHENSPMHFAAQKNHLEIIRILLQRGAQIDARNRKRETPFHWACAFADIDLIEFMIKHGAGINAVEDEGGTPLSWACYEGRENVVAFLCDHDVNINLADMENNTPLYWACYRGHNNIVRFLIEKKADFRKLNNKGDSILDAAIKNGQTKTVDLLLSYLENLF